MSRPRRVLVTLALSAAALAAIALPTAASAVEVAGRYWRS